MVSRRLVVIVLALSGLTVAQEKAIFPSPVAARYSPDGKTLAVSDRVSGALWMIEGQKLTRRVALEGKTGALAWAADGVSVYIVEYDKGTIAQVKRDGTISRRFEAGAYPNGVALAAKKNLLLATSTVMNHLTIVDLKSGREKARVKLPREPSLIAISPAEDVALISNLLPAGPASDPRTSSEVSVVSLDSLEVANIKLPPNSTSVRGVAVSPDGKWGYVVHSVARATLPTTQLDRGWVNTNGFSIIDLAGRKHHATLLLDSVVQGAADPWDVVVSRDGATALVSLAGAQQIARIDLANLHNLLEGRSAATVKKASMPTIWDDIRADRAKRSELVNDLSALYVANLITRANVPGQGPRGLDLSSDGATLAVAQYFSGDVALLDAATLKPIGAIAAPSTPAETEVRRGERIFHDARYTFQHWLSCATCHPNEGRVDGLNWDQLNDGVGNPKNNKSLLHAHLTPPSMWLGVREGMDEASMAGFKFASRQPEQKDLDAVRAYIRSLTPEKSPHRLADGALSEAATRGKKVFDDPKVNCVHCHSGDLFTNLKRFDVGTAGPLDHAGETFFDTPSLVELWRTAPYLHDGRAATLKEVFTKHNAKDQHGVTSHLSDKQLDDLIEYLLSLP